MKTILITGVTGQDGSHMVDYLLKNAPDYLIFGGVRRLSVKNHDNIKHIDNHRFKLINLDITDSHSIEEAVTTYKPDYFINFAANSFVGTSWSMPANHMNTNTMGVLYCLEAIRKYSPLTKFYNAGSSEQFGDVLYSPQDENHPFRPRSPYGASKCAAHHLVKVYRESYNLYAVQGILFNHEGIRRGEEFVTRKITKNVVRIKKAMEAGCSFNPLILGNINSKRDWSDAEDFVDGVWKMLNQQKPQDYVLASGETHTIKEFVEEAFSCVGIKGIWLGEGLDEKYTWEVDKKTTLVTISEYYYRPAEVELLMGNAVRAKKELNWVPKSNFFDLVNKMIINDYEKLQ
jgi:GDPmannose 4,6-dehydratase